MIEIPELSITDLTIANGFMAFGGKTMTTRVLKRPPDLLLLP